MPIRVPNGLPALEQLARENVFSMSLDRAEHQDIRPLRLLILNLMPVKIVSETQLVRLLANSPLQIEVEFLHVKSHISHNTPKQHLDIFYRDLEQVLNQQYDGLIITGAAVDGIQFEEVDYWDEFCLILDWATYHVNSTLYLCWGAMAGLYYRYGINKKVLPRKISGIYQHRLVQPKCPLVRGFDDCFYAPHSRYGDIDASELQQHTGLRVIADSPQAGFYLAMDEEGREIFVTGHPEYDSHTLQDEYLRDLKKGISPELPENYFPENDPQQTPSLTWRAHANLLLGNWLNYYVYQLTPYDLSQLTPIKVRQARGRSPLDVKKG